MTDTCSESNCHQRALEGRNECGTHLPEVLLIAELDAAVARAVEAEHELGAERMARDELAKEFGGHREAWGKQKWEMKAEAERLRKDVAALRLQHVALRVAARAAVEALDDGLSAHCRTEYDRLGKMHDAAASALAALRKCLGE